MRLITNLVSIKLVLRIVIHLKVKLNVPTKTLVIGNAIFLIKHPLIFISEWCAVFFSTSDTNIVPFFLSQYRASKYCLTFIGR